MIGYKRNVANITLIKVSFLIVVHMFNFELSWYYFFLLQRMDIKSYMFLKIIIGVLSCYDFYSIRSSLFHHTFFFRQWYSHLFLTLTFRHSGSETTIYVTDVYTFIKSSWKLELKLGWSGTFKFYCNHIRAAVDKALACVSINLEFSGHYFVPVATHGYDLVT
jgi:hypothetical protein